MGVQKLSNFCCFIFVFTIFPSFSLGWSQEELSLFDLVDEFRGNFYEFLEVPKTAADAEIRKAYRKLSLKLHPDRNPDPQADVHFRQLTAIYDVLKDEALRKRYDEILEFGLPDWRQPVFYYRHLRRMPWWEFVFILIFILTGGHYLVLWAAYWEKKFEFEELFGSKMRRKEKKLQRKFKVDVDEIIQKSMDSQIPKPSWRQLLPIILIRTLKNSIFGLPQFFIATIQNFRDLREEKRLKLEAAQIAVEAELAVVPKVKKRIRLEDLDLPSAEDSADLRPVFNQIELESNQTVEEIITGDWTAQEVSELIRFSQKFPTGTPDRWEKISRLLRRKAQDVTDMVGQLKHLDPKGLFSKITKKINE